MTTPGGLESCTTGVRVQHKTHLNVLAQKTMCEINPNKDSVACDSSRGHCLCEEKGGVENMLAEEGVWKTPQAELPATRR